MNPEQNVVGARRTFLKAGGIGLAAGGAGLLVHASPAAASMPPFAKNLKDDFGAVGNGTADDTAAIQNAFTTLSTTSAGIKGAYLYVPPGEYVIKSTIDISKFAGVIQGPGVGNTPSYTASGNSAGLGAAFRWGGTTASVPMFRIRDSRHVGIRDLRFVGSDTATPSAAINFNKLQTDSVGSNENLVIEDCTFGVWPWTSQGTYTGKVAVGILFDGYNADNDQFQINRCIFRGKTGGTTTGISLVNTQSIWGSINDCSFESLSTGISTSSSTTLYNPQFQTCANDITIASTARVDVFGWQSENSSNMATLGPNSALRVVGGSVLISASMPAQSGALINAFPSNSDQTVTLKGVRFLYTGTLEDNATKPTIAFGPSSPSNASGSSGFHIEVDDCTGLYASQCEFKGSLWASSPRSRGQVIWQSRHKLGVVQFRNELWQGTQAGTRTTLNTNVWDQPLAGTNN